ncbi:MAG TPA: flagellar FlbD family protein [Thermoanaerobacterales bacterium]|uniref:flagellar FlbD family protein n=1 Tax=Tepidanaerobacter sp. GT38 TaxID=2722793 RepID=UPI00184DDAEF|nr:flagellar FlbD family protein [Tepidanaerobacter sp. GT38]HHY41911.1 flagellar FlbD family protein [Thermoanaerobacterales bacterium]
MIKLTKLNGKTFVLNAELIETVESTPDTVVTLTTGKKYIVNEEIDEIVSKVIQYKKQIFSGETLKT